MTGFRGVALGVRVRPRMSWMVLAAPGSVPDVEHGGGANGQGLELGCLQRSNG